MYWSSLADYSLEVKVLWMIVLLNTSVDDDE